MKEQLRPHIIEGIGTFFLTLVIALTGHPLAIGAILMAMVYVGSQYSGAHFNPAVSLAVFIRGKATLGQTVTYITAQILAATAASFAYFFITRQHFSPTPTSPLLPSVIIVELVFTFALCFTVLVVATHERAVPNHYFGLAIGAVLLAGVLAGGEISGGILNPAVVLGSKLVDLAAISVQLPTISIYLGSQLVGGIGAGAVYKAIS